ncbi:hypothetical protein OUZ56_025255 [Daphnia magna]|uniref:GMPS ATP-PPase domain-containing protein n=1 Tax=Daphnia magna TaxID=35525 RepID=A0ABQ9ZJA3_9CRUS|nr:hypothetical protein OUZ56_025255 [Daphnia magna]
MPKSCVALQNIHVTLFPPLLILNAVFMESSSILKLILMKTDEKCCITSCSTSVDCKEFSHWRNASSSVSIRPAGRSKFGLILVNGGFDSAVRAVLLLKALLQSDDSSRVHVIHIDNGFLRKDESVQVVTSLQLVGLNLRVI